MAEGWAKHLAPTFDVHSAGTFPSREVNPVAVTVMAEKGVDISDHKPKTFTSIPKPLDLVVAVCGQAAEHCPVIPGATTERWDLEDPAAFEGNEDATLQVFRDSRDEIEWRVRDLVKRFA